MKLYLVTSDSHGDIRSLKSVLGQYPMISSVLHLGDYQKDGLILQALYPDKTFTMVSGNCDSLQDSTDEVWEEEGLKLWMTHGHRYQVKSSLDRLKSRIRSEHYHVVLFGHTHQPHLERYEGCLLVNPGSVGYPRYDGPPTFALLEIGSGRAEARIMEVL